MCILFPFPSGTHSRTRNLHFARIRRSRESAYIMPCTVQMALHDMIMIIGERGPPMKRRVCVRACVRACLRVLKVFFALCVSTLCAINLENIYERASVWCKPRFDNEKSRVKWEMGVRTSFLLAVQPIRQHTQTSDGRRCECECVCARAHTRHE